MWLTHSIIYTIAYYHLSRILVSLHTIIFVSMIFNVWYSKFLILLVLSVYKIIFFFNTFTQMTLKIMCQDFFLLPKPKLSWSWTILKIGI